MTKWEALIGLLLFLLLTGVRLECNFADLSSLHTSHSELELDKMFSNHHNESNANALPQKGVWEFIF